MARLQGRGDGQDLSAGASDGGLISSISSRWRFIQLHLSLYTCSCISPLHIHRHGCSFPYVALFLLSTRSRLASGSLRTSLIYLLTLFMNYVVPFIVLRLKPEVEALALHN